MQFSNVAPFVAVFTLAGITAVNAATISSGSYQGSTGATQQFNGGAGGDAYTLSSGDLTVAGGSFIGGTGGQGNGVNVGIFIPGTGGNGGNALNVSGASTFAITSGSFAGGNGGPGTYSSNGGQQGAALFLQNTTVGQIRGGTFSGNSALGIFQLFTSAKLTFYGAFSLPSGTILTGNGTFTGTLVNNTTSATYSYAANDSSTITLINPAAAVPEPTTVAAVAAMGMIALRRRHRAV